MAEKLEQDHATPELAEQESSFRHVIRIAGPGLITGGADNDPSGIATYSVVGATTGFSQLWLLVISVPLLIAVQGIAARLGNVTKLGLAELIRNEFGRPIALAAGTLTVIANVATIGADLVAMAAVLELLTHIHLVFFIVPLVVIMGYLTIFQDFKVIERFLLWMVSIFFTYVVAGFLSHPHWSSVLMQTVIPPVRPNLTYFAGPDCVDGDPGQPEPRDGRFRGKPVGASGGMERLPHHGAGRYRAPLRLDHRLERLVSPRRFSRNGPTVRHRSLAADQACNHRSRVP